MELRWGGTGFKGEDGGQRGDEDRRRLFEIKLARIPVEKGGLTFPRG